MATITKINLKKLGLPPKTEYLIWISCTGYDPKRHRVIVRVNNSFFEPNPKTLLIDINLIPNAKNIINDFINTKILRIYAQLYDFIDDKIIDTQRQEHEYNALMQIYRQSDEMLKSLPAVMDNFWRKNKSVTKIEGPFDLENKIVSTIKQGEKYIFKASANQILTETEMLSIKWAYKYDDKKIEPFKHQTEQIIDGQNYMTCSFPKGIDVGNIMVYGYFLSVSENVAVKMGVEKVEGESSNENSGKLIWSSKVNPAFCEKVIDIAERLGLPTVNNQGANWLMAIMALETSRTFSPSTGTFTKEKKDNQNGFVGLIQFGKEVSKDLGTKRTDLIKMTALEQLDYVEKYFKLKQFEGKLKTITDLYLAVNYQVACGHGSEKNYVVYDNTKAAYDQNPLFKREKDEFYFEKGKKKYYTGKKGKSYIWEFEEVINEYYEEGKNNSGKTEDKEPEYNGVFNATGIVTYHIYNDGKIEKHIPKIIKEEFKSKYSYVYHDSKDIEHSIGSFKFFKTIEMNPGNVSGKNDVELIDARQFKGYSKDDLKFKFLTWNSDSDRWFINPECFAGLLGAMANNNINFIGFNGFSNIKAESVGGSKSHRNGKRGDLRYLSNKKNGEPILLTSSNFDFDFQNTFNDSLFLFGWGKTELMYSENFTYKGKKNVLLNHTKHMRKDGSDGYRHNHHLHLTGFQHSLIKIIKE
jgi:hypothetical protein